MRLNNFEEHIDCTILERGYKYYKNGRVLSLRLNGTKWSAKVEGSDDYTVSVILSDSSEITDSICDCPYYMGSYCKHQVAVFYALRDEYANTAKTLSETNHSGLTGSKKRKKSLEEILQTIDKPSLIAIIIELADSDNGIKNALMMRFSDRNDMYERARKLIKGAIRSVMRRGFVEYSYTHAATEGAEKVLGMAVKLKDGSDILSCVRLCVIVAEEMMDFMENCDDSNGYVGGMVDSAIELLSEAAGKLPQGDPATEEVFHTIISHADNNIYNGWSDLRFSLIAACIPFCGDPKLRGELEDYCMRIRIQDSKSEWNSKYTNERIQHIAFDIISRFDGPECAKVFIEQNLENSNFRKIVVEKALLDDPERALELCLDGERLDAQYAGIVDQWKNYRYKAYELQNNIDGQKSLAMEFVIDGSFGYFHKLKALYLPDEWGGVLERLLRDLEASGNIHRVYVDILVNEGLKSLLLQYVRDYNNALIRLYPHLLPEYKEDVGEMFEKLIIEQAVRASNRSAYKDVCGIIKHYAKACGKQYADTIKKSLAERYQRRPAFIDELNKI